MLIESEYWNSIPNELKVYPHWCIAGQNKAPMLVSKEGLLYNASPISGPWFDFEIACYFAKQFNYNIGYIITKDDPFCCIDLDVKDSTSIKNGVPLTPEEWTQQSQLDWYSGIVQNAESYTELSASRLGLHIWVKGQIGKGKKRKGIEIYSQERFIICTGIPVSDVKYHILNNQAIPIILQQAILPIVERQHLIEVINEELGVSNTADIDLIELAAELTDEEIWKRGSTAGNSEKFIDLCNGKWKEYGFPSQSEADLALMSMFTFYSHSNEQCRRMFRQTKLGEREKAIKNDYYLNLTLKLVRARQEQEKQNEVKIDLAAMEIQDKIRKEERRKIAFDYVKELQEKQVKEMNSHINTINLPKIDGLDWPPGMVGAIASFIYHSAPRPVKEVSIVAALGLLAGVCGKAYHITQSGLNLYLILIARSAIGKEAMHSGIGLILKTITGQAPTAERFVDFTDFASGPALVKACEANTSFVNVSGEWGRKLRRLSNEDNRDGPMQQLRTAMINLYQKSGPESIVGGITYSNKDKNIASVNGIAYSMIGETTPSTFYDSLTPSMMEDGFLSRFTIIEYNGERPKANKTPITTMDPYLLECLVSLVINCTKLLDMHQSIKIQYSNEALKLLDDFDIECDNNINNACEDESKRQMWNRAHLKANRIAGLLAVADNFITPIIQPIHADWAIKLILKDISIMNTKIESGDIGLDDDTRVKKLLSICKEFIRGEVPTSYNIPNQMITDGIIPRKFLQLRTSQLNSFTKHRLGSLASLDQIIKSIIDSGYVIEVNKDKAVEMYNFHGRCFRVVSLPGGIK